MKKITLMMTAAIAAASAFAAPTVGHKALSMQSQTKQEMHQASGKAISDINHKQLDLKRVQTAQHKSRAAQDIIYYAEGRNQDYMTNSVGFVVYWGMYLDFATNQTFKQVVWGDDDKVYFKDLVGIGLDTYVEGTYADDQVTVDFPQGIIDEEGQILSLAVLKFDEEAYTYVVAPDDCQQVTYTVSADGTLTLNLNDGYSYDNYLEEEQYPEYIIGLVDDATAGATDVWYGYGDACQEFVEFNQVPVALPDGANVEKWTIRRYDESGNACSGFVEVAICGNDIYLGGISSKYPEGWAKGTLNGETAYFPSGQYQGYAEDYMTPLFFLTGTFSEVYLEEWDYWDFHIEFSEGIEFTYDAKKKSLTPANEDDCIVINGKMDDLYYLTILVDPVLAWQDPALCNAAPLNPEVIDYEPWAEQDWGNQGSITWSIPSENVKGAILDTDNMYYNFIVDGEIYGLDPEEYTYVEEYIEDIPYNYTEDWDIYIAGDVHQLYFSFDGAETLGIQSFYVGTNGTVYSSDIVTYDVETGEVTVEGATDAIRAVDTSVQPVSCKYYDMAGRQVTSPQAGIYIKVMKMADGTTRTVKVNVK